MSMRVLEDFALKFVRRGLSAMILAALALGVTCAGQAQSRAGATTTPAIPAAAAVQRPAPPQATSNGLNTGIKVHGHWIIEVRNPNGTLVSHTEFENSYADADGLLIGFLTRSESIGEWGIVLGDPNSPPCSANLGFFVLGNLTLNYPDNNNLCLITERPFPAPLSYTNCGSAPASGCSQNLSVGFTNTGIGLSLGGSVVAENSGTISQVQTVVTSCGSNVATSTCATETTADSQITDLADAFTAIALPAQGSGQCGGTNQPSCAVSVTSGQSIAVTVTITFQ